MLVRSAFKIRTQGQRGQRFLERFVAPLECFDLPLHSRVLACCDIVAEASTPEVMAGVDRLPVGLYLQLGAADDVAVADLNRVHASVKAGFEPDLIVVECRAAPLAPPVIFALVALCVADAQALGKADESIGSG